MAHKLNHSKGDKIEFVDISDSGNVMTVNVDYMWAATRCRGITTIVKNCMKEYRRYNGMNKGQREGFTLLLTHVQELHDLVSKYSKRNFIMRGLKASSFKASYEEVDKQISTDVQIIQAGLGARR